MYDYEGARDNFVKAITLNKKVGPVSKMEEKKGMLCEDEGYIVWLGVTQLYLGVQYSFKMQR